jgi:two-component system, OmpR family, response regulator RstA
MSDSALAAVQGREFDSAAFQPAAAPLQRLKEAPATGPVADAPLVTVRATALTPACGAWCEALRAEGIAPQREGTAPASAIVVLLCHERLTAQLDLLRRLRQSEPQRLLVVVGPELRELEQVLALEMGADEVVDWRTGAAVVAARLRALWRRGSTVAAAAPPLRGPEHLHFGRLSLHLRERAVLLRGERLAFTECEFEVLWLLAAQAGQAVSRTELIERLRGLPYQRLDRSIDCRIYRLRAKLGDTRGPVQHIRTVRNRGYLFSPAPW